jgi:hypothetical protein
MVAAHAEATARGVGAVLLDGRLLDAPLVVSAERVLRIHEVLLLQANRGAAGSEPRPVKAAGVAAVDCGGQQARRLHKVRGLAGI